MSSVSFIEQLTSSVSLSMLGIVSTTILGVLLVYTVVGRLFSSSSKSKNTSSTKTQKANIKKQQQQDGATSSNKKKNTKTNKNVVPVSSSSPSSQSEESENEKTTSVEPSPKSTPTTKVTTSKKVTTGENNEKKTTATKQQQQPTVRNEKVEEKKKSKIDASNKQQVSGKGDVATKVDNSKANKKQPTAAVNVEVKQTPTVVNEEVDIDEEDDGEWVTQSNKQVSNRNRNKTKTVTNNQTSPSVSNRKTASEKRSVVRTSNENTTSPVKNQSDAEPKTPNQEPFDIYQLLPTNENNYTNNDNWWKQTVNKQQTFSVNDITEWPEREQNEQYTVQVKRIIPIKKSNEEQNNHDSVEIN